MKMKSHIRDGFKMRPSCGAAYVLPPRSAQVRASALKFGLIVSSDRGEKQTGAYVTQYESQSEDDHQMPLERRPFVSVWCSVVGGVGCYDAFLNSLEQPVHFLFFSPPRPQQTGSNDEAFCATGAGVLRMMTMVLSKPGICCLNFELQSVLIHNLIPLFSWLFLFNYLVRCVGLPFNRPVIGAFGSCLCPFNSDKKETL